MSTRAMIVFLVFLFLAAMLVICSGDMTPLDGSYP
jgi:hypothetical protein